MAKIAYPLIQHDMFMIRQDTFANAWASQRLCPKSMLCSTSFWHIAQIN